MVLGAAKEGKFFGISRISMMTLFWSLWLERNARTSEGKRKKMWGFYGFYQFQTSF